MFIFDASDSELLFHQKVHDDGVTAAIPLPDQVGYFKHTV